MTENEISRVIVDCCFTIHRQLGTGLFESVYEEILTYELQKT
jgi:GxxExxY protein